MNQKNVIENLQRDLIELIDYLFKKHEDIFLEVIRNNKEFTASQRTKMICEFRDKVNPIYDYLSGGKENV